MCRSPPVHGTRDSPHPRTANRRRTNILTPRINPPDAFSLRWERWPVLRSPLTVGVNLHRSCTDFLRSVSSSCCARHCIAGVRRCQISTKLTSPRSASRPSPHRSFPRLVPQGAAHKPLGARGQRVSFAIAGKLQRATHLKRRGAISMNIIRGQTKQKPLGNQGFCVLVVFSDYMNWRSQRDSNPRRSLERAVS